FVRLAARLALDRQDDSLSVEAFEPLIDNRARNLRGQMVNSLHREKQLPSRYYALLSQLQTAQTPALTSGSGAEVRKILIALDAIQNTMGLGEVQSSLNEIHAHQRATARAIQ